MNKPVGSNWKVTKGSASGDTFWLKHTGLQLSGYIFLKADNKVVPFGQCKWVNGYNIPLYAYNKTGNGDLSTAVLFNLEPLDNEVKKTIQREFTRLAKPVDELAAKFPINGTDEQKRQARVELAKADRQLISNFQWYVAQSHRLFADYDGTGKNKRDLIPEKGYYNALMYKWYRADNIIDVYRLKIPARRFDAAQWVETKKVEGNGEIVKE